MLKHRILKLAIAAAMITSGLGLTGLDTTASAASAANQPAAVTAGWTGVPGNY